MSLRSRIRQLKKRLAPGGGLPAPELCTVYVEAGAPAVDPGPIRWGSVDGLPEIFERGQDESENAFVARLLALRPMPRSAVTIHSLSRRPV